MCSAALEKRKYGSKDVIEVPDGKHTREVNFDRYRYLRMLQLYSIMTREMNEKVKSEYIRRESINP